MSCCPQHFHTVLDVADLAQQTSDGAEGVSKVRVGDEVWGGCGVHVLVYPGPLTGQLLNVQHFQCLPANVVMLLETLFCFLYGVRLSASSEGLNHTSKTFGHRDTVTQERLHLLWGRGEMGEGDRGRGGEE